jgi:DNA-binding CsgD family transcriptional regulator
MFATEFDRNAAMLAECSEIAAGLDDDRLDARIKECQGHATLYQGDLPAAIGLLEEANSEFRLVGDPLGEFDTLILLTAATFFLDDPRADEFARQALALAEGHQALSSKAYGLWSVGITQWRAGAHAEATRTLRDCVRLFGSMHDLTGISFGVQALSWCAAFTSPDERAARLLGASQAVWRTSGAKVDETNAYSGFDDRSADQVRAVLGPEPYEQAFAEGAAYSFEQAVSLALGDDPGRAGGDRAAATRGRSAAPGGLTRREWEIAGLLAEGLTNKEIAARLVISQRTAETHVDHILGKLGMTSRAQVAAWVADQQPR